MTDPVQRPMTLTGRAVFDNRLEDGTPDEYIRWLVAAEQEAAKAERERLHAKMMAEIQRGTQPSWGNFAEFVLGTEPRS